METSLGPAAPRNQRVPHGDKAKNLATPPLSAAKGESGRTIPAWYVVRGVFGKAKDLHQFLQSEGHESFYPMRYRLSGTTKKAVAAIPNLCFVHGTRQEVMSVIDAKEGKAYRLSQYLTPCIDPATKQMMLVPDDEMARFRDAFTLIGEQAVWLDPKTLNLKEGDRVRVVDGQFKGVEGYIKRIYGQQRVVVTLQNFAAIATAYVPTPLLERIAEE